VIKSLRIDWRAVAFVLFVSFAMTLAIALISVRFAARHTALNPMLAARPGGRAGAGSDVCSSPRRSRSASHSCSEVRSSSEVSVLSGARIRACGSAMPLCCGSI
jgi:uncharacterized membrane protein